MDDRRWPTRRRAIAALVLMPALATAAARPATHTITIENMQFSPRTLTIKRGDRVVWVNKDLVAHTATAGKLFDSRSLAPGASWSFVPPRAGRFAYACSLHPTMTATLVVE